MDLLKYHNHINEINFNGFSEKELNLFFSLIFMAHEKKQIKLTIPFSELKILADGDKNKDRFIKNIENVNIKLIKLAHRLKIGNKIHTFSLFNIFTIDLDNDELTVQINEIFSYMLNDLVGNFTKFDLIEFVNLKSSYSKNMFKLLKQWESKKIKIFNIDDFRNILNVPTGFSISKINERVLKPIMEELPQYFPNLQLEKIKTGRKVTSLKFIWNKKNEQVEEEKNINSDVEIVDIIEISEKLNNTIEKAKKNKYITKLLTTDNIEILLQMFNENDLIKGFMWAYKEIKQDISTLNYLIKAIRTGAEQKEKKLVVKKLELEEAKEVIRPDEIPVENLLKQISKDEYKQLYNNYLELNQVEHSIFTKQAFDMMNKNKYEIIEVEKELKEENESIEKLEQELQELGATKTTVRLMKADLKRIIKLNTMKTPTEIEVLETVLGVMKEIIDPFNATMSETDLKVIREQAKKYKIKLEW